MKKMKACIFAVLLSLSVFAMTACGGNGGNQSTNQSGQPSASQDASGQDNERDSAASENKDGGNESDPGSGDGESRTSVQEESTGVLDGLMDDMESGAEDIRGDSEGASNHADESRD